MNRVFKTCTCLLAVFMVSSETILPKTNWQFLNCQSWSFITVHSQFQSNRLGLYCQLKSDLENTKESTLASVYWYYLIYLTLHWPFLIIVRQCSLSIKRYVYSCRTWQPGLMNALFTDLMCGIVAQWLRFWAVNQETLGSNPAKTIVIFYVLYFWHFYSLNKRWILFL